MVVYSVRAKRTKRVKEEIRLNVNEFEGKVLLIPEVDQQAAQGFLPLTNTDLVCPLRQGNYPF